jgi:hypothetical protein
VADIVDEPSWWKRGHHDGGPVGGGVDPFRGAGDRD